jgi:hypothetical protein
MGESNTRFDFDQAAQLRRRAESSSRKTVHGRRKDVMCEHLTTPFGNSVSFDNPVDRFRFRRSAEGAFLIV